MKKQILIVGFGAMGCRHVQSLLSQTHLYDLHVIEPSINIIQSNNDKIGATVDDYKWYKSLEEIDSKIDLAIIATSAGPRFELMKALLIKGVSYFLLEKIVFQSQNQFDYIIKLMKESGAKAWCNFVNRYFSPYNKILSELKYERSPLNMTVYGGSFGLGCNAIHYIDIFQYITQTQDLNIHSSSLSTLKSENRRGDCYKEFLGNLHLENSKKDKLFIIAEEKFSGGIVINISTEDLLFNISEESQTFHFISEGQLVIEKFNIIPTSQLTEVIIKDIFKDDCRLSRLEDTYNAHVALFKEINTYLYQVNNVETICPIT